MDAAWADHWARFIVRHIKEFPRATPLRERIRHIAISQGLDLDETDCEQLLRRVRHMQASAGKNRKPP